MVKFFKYLGTDVFRKNLIRAIVGIAVLLVIIFFALRFYTRHGQTVLVPELEGLSVAEAIQKLESLNFEYELDSVYQMDLAPGLVIEQDPDAGTKVKENRTLYLTMITQVAPEVGFPELIEKTFVEARSILASYGLRLGDTTYKADIARDVVLAVKFGGQTLSTGRMIPKGSSIDLVLGDGRGENEVQVPDLTGLTFEEARFALQGSSLSIGEISFTGASRDTLNARVVSQSPAPDEPRVSIGSPISIRLHAN